ncbi:LysR family transcriptional regulator [Paraburkholderia sp. BL6669N2]|uniref:LysR family transcriptional regulator n=1 Tax=Paraburkholderia sp. BL6669N2 TaxID=1938807 RepID=UPI000E26469D|nr:LysR family transcriptional regulator [Paraburkholderia sp. BL6669N2]REG49144.1 LysR family transcriptional regulator [Paraburkholderia sp. BL6669N2]
MFTFKQMEALYWIVQLGSFEAAAGKLNSSQSAISKRIHELESTFDFAVFDRTSRTARITEKGNELFEYAKELLGRRDEIVERVSANEVLVRRIRIGVTELTALTWLPRLISAVRDAYPKVIVEAEVDLSIALRERLAADTVDLIIVPELPTSERFVSVPVGKAEHTWMYSPSRYAAKSTIPLGEIAQFPLLLQGNLSGSGLIYTRFLSENGVSLAKVLTVNNLVAQVGLTVSGMGVSHLPKSCLNYMISAGALKAIRTRPALPPIHYVALHRGEHSYSLCDQIAQLAAKYCDFSVNILDPRAISSAS